MASLTKTWKTQTLNCLGPGQTTKWYAFNWGTGTWGIKSSGAGGLPQTIHNITKVWTGANGPSQLNTISSTCPAANVIPHRIIRLFWSGQNKCLPLGTVQGLYQSDGSGYEYCYDGSNPNIISATASPGWANFSDGATSYTTYTPTTASWVTSASY